MSQVKSTYNFVPAPEEHEVFEPSWADHVSHDIPFEDGESGEIEIEITAETPIFIRDGHAKGNETNEFSHVVVNGEKKYFIPATSLKGMIRNHVEILSFSRLNKSLVNNDRYSFRDLTRESEYMKSYDTNKVKAGWLSEDKEGNWTINECTFNHIHHSEVDSILCTNFRKNYLDKQPEKKSGSAKYELLNGKSLTSTFGLKESKSKPKGLAIFDSNGKKGTIVFTGQSGPRKESKDKKPSGKVHEFVFYDGIVSTIKLNEKQINDFKFIYLDHDKNNISPDWKYWREKLAKGEKVPVFFNKLGDDKIKHFGLAYMYKLPYENSVHEMSPLFKYKSSQDLANLLFGYSSKESNLKGRVIFGHAFAKNVKVGQTKKDILGGPKASFTPFYLEQTNTSKILTFQEKGSLKGFKKYPIHGSQKTIKYSDEQLKNNNVFSFYTPLESGSTFKTKIRYHNLTKVELGALISAISFHNNSDSFYYNLGGMKSLGLGCVQLKIKDIEQFKDAMQRYEYALNIHTQKNLNCNWIESSNVIELFSIASKPINSSIDDKLIYPVIGKEGKNGTDDNEFIQIKKQKTFLESYSTINQIEKPKSILTKEVIAIWEALRIEKEQKIEEEKKVKIAEFESLISNARLLLSKHDFENSELNYRKAISLINDNSLDRFLIELKQKREEKEEKDAYQNALSSNEKTILKDFVLKYPISIYKEEISNKIKIRDAVSGIPGNIKDKDNLKQFGNNTDNWVKKINKDNQSIKSLGFEDEHIVQLYQIYAIEKTKPKLIKKWYKYKSAFTNWYGVEKANEIFQKLTL